MDEGTESDLTVRLEELTAPGAAAGLSLIFAPTENEIPVSVVLKAPGFYIAGDSHAIMICNG
jgi:ABC-type Fe3+ transport system permease subunit